MIKAEAAQEKTWVYAKRDVELLVEPEGVAHTPTSLNHAPLTILAGTRLWPVQIEGDWVLVSSPSYTLGWVKSEDISELPQIQKYLLVN